MKTSRKDLGRLGEDEACTFLSSLGQTILERNWRHSHYELDIISTDGLTLHIVEVKTRIAPISADPLSNVTGKKQSNLVKGALAYLHSADRKRLPSGDFEVQFDIITVVFDGFGTNIEYYPRAWIPIYR